MNSRHSFRALLLAAAASIAPNASHAATLYWDGGASTVNSQSDNATLTGQNWFSGGNWDNGTTSAALASWAAGDNAVFGGSASSQTITAGTLTIGNMTFGSGALGAGTSGTAYTVTGGTITLSSTTITTNTNATISSVLAGSSTLTKAGAGTLSLNAASSFTGNITVSAGILDVFGTFNNSNPTTSSLGNMTTAGRTITVNTGGTLRFSAADAIGQYNYKTAVTLIADGGTITRVASANSFNSIGDVQLKNGGRITTTNGNAGTVGSFAINGTVTVSGTSGSFIDSLSGQTSNNYINLGTIGGTTTFNVGSTGDATADLTVSAVLGDKVLGGAAALTKSGAGLMLLSGANSYTGATTISTGTIKLGNAAGLGTTAAGTTVSSGAVLDLGGQTVGGEAVSISGTGISTGGALINSSGTAASLSGAITLAANSSIGGSGNVTLSGGFSGAFSLTKYGSGTATLSAPGDYDGNVIVSAGTLRLNDVRQMNGTVTVESGATLQVENNGSGGYYQPTSLTVNGGTVSTVPTGTNRYHGIYTPTINFSSATTSTVGVPIYISKTGATATETLTITVPTNGVAVITGTVLYHPDISGGSLVKSGGGTLTLSGTSSSGNSTTLTGNVTVSGGTLNIGGTVNTSNPTVTAIGNMNTAGRTITVNSGATLAFIAADAIGAYNFKTPVKLIADGGTITRIASANTFNAIGDVDLKNGGRLTSTNGNSSTVGSFGLNGDVTVSGTSGSFIDTLSGQTSNSFISLGTTAGSTTFNVGSTGDATADLTVSAVLADKTLGGAATLIKAGAGKMLVSSANTYSGGTTLRAGTLVAKNNSALGTGAVTLNDASTSSSNTSLLIDATSASVTIDRGITIANQGSGTATLGSATTSGSSTAAFSGNITLNKAVTLSGGTSGDRLSFTGGITGTANVTIAGSNRVIFIGTDKTYAGTTTVNSGATLQLSDGSTSTADLLPNAYDVTVTGALKLAKNGNSETIAGLNGAGTVSAIAGSDTLIVGSGNANGAFSGQLNNAGGTLAFTKIGTGTQTLSGTNGYTGATAVNNGTLSLTGSLNSGSTVTVANGAILSGTGTANGQVNLSSGGILTPGVSGSGTLTLGSLVFGSAAGDTSTVNIGISGLPGSAVTSSALQVNGNITANGGNRSVTFAFGSTLATLASGTYQLVGYTGTQLANLSAFTYSGTQGARQGLSLVDNGAKVISLQVDTAYPLWTGASTDWSAAAGLSAATSAWKLNDQSATPAAFLTNDTVHFDSTASSGTVQLTADVAPVSVAFEGDTLAYTLSSPGNYKITSGLLTKSGASTLTINNANTFSGGTTITGGQLVMGDAGALGSGSISISSSGQLDINGKTVANAIVLAGGSIIGSGTLEGAISESGAARGISTGASLTLKGVSSFTGASTITAGTLEVGGSGQLGGGSYAANIANAGTLKINTTATQALGGVISGAGSLVKDNTGALTLSGNNTFSGDITVSGGSLIVTGTLGYDGTNGAYAGNIANNGAAALTLGSASNQTLSGAISGSAGLTKSSSGALTLSGNNTFAGGIAISGGSLTVSGTLGYDGSAGTYAGNITNSGASALVLSSASNQTLSGIISGTAGIAKSGNGALTLSGNNTFAGAVSVSAGSLTLSGSNTFTGDITLTGGSLTVTGTLGSNASYAGNIANGGASALTFGSNSDQALSGVISGARGLTKSGNGKLTLSGGASTMTGDITITGGTVSVTAASATAISATPSNSGLGNMTVSRTITVDGSNSVLEFNAADAIGAFGYVTPVMLVAKNGGVIARASTNGAFNSIGALTLQEGGILRANAGSSAIVQSLSLNGNVTVLGTALGGTIEALAGANNGIHLRSVGSSGNITFDVADTSAAADLNVTANLLNPVQVNYLGYNATNTTAGIIKSGAGRMVLAGTNTFTGSTTVNAGTLAITGSNAAGGNYTVAAGATLSVTGNGVIFRQAYSGSSISLASGSVLELKNWSYDDTSAKTTSLGGLSANASSITVNGGTIRMVGTGTTTYGRGITVNSGGATLEAASGVTWNLDNGGDGNVAFVYNGSPSLTLTGAGNGNLNKSFSGSGLLTKDGAGTWTLSAANSHTGGTTVSLGRLVGTSASLTGNILNNAAVTFSQSTAGAYTGNMSGTGSLTKSGNGTLTLSGSNSYSGATAVDAGKLLVSSAGALASSTVVTVGASGTLALGYSLTNDLTIANTLLGSGTLELATSGAYALTLSGLGGFSGSIKLSSGIFDSLGSGWEGKSLVFAGGSLSANSLAAHTGETTVASGTTLSAGSVLPSNLVLQSGATVDFASASGNALTAEIKYTGGSLSNASAYQGNLVVQSGSTVDVGSALGNGKLVVGSGAVANLTSSIANDVNFQGGRITGGSNLAGTVNLASGTLKVGAQAGEAGVDTLGSSSTVALTGGSLDLNNVSGLANTINYTSGTISNGSAFGGTVNVQANATLSNAGTLGGTVNVASDAAVSNSGTLSGAVAVSGGTLTNTGTVGALTVNTGSATNQSGGTVSGSVTVAGGSLVNNGTVSGVTDVQTGGTIGGSGQFADTTVGSGATLSPGNSPGVLSFNGTLTLSGGAVWNQQIYSQEQTISFGPHTGDAGYDQVDITSGGLDLSGASSGNQITLRLITLTNWQDSAAGTPDASRLFFVKDGRVNYFPREFTLATYDGSAVVAPGESIASVFNFDLSGFSYSNGVSGGAIAASSHPWGVPFALSEKSLGSGRYALTLQVIPEPSTYGLMLGGLGLAAAALRRRRKMAK